MTRKDRRLINLVVFGSCLALAAWYIHPAEPDKIVQDPTVRPISNNQVIMGDIGVSFPATHKFPIRIRLMSSNTFSSFPFTITVHGAMPDCYLTVDTPLESKDIQIKIYKGSPPKYKHHTHTTRKVR